MSQQETRLDIVRGQYALYKERPMDLTLARGIPSQKQLKLSESLINDVKIEDFLSEDEIDIRNYGGLYGIREARELFGTAFEHDRRRNVRRRELKPSAHV
ncbi:MAG: hypothetical protein U5K84_11430 [Alkalibacterium sp.]|nr:hypothetical protein [Alkalibacterium sp.]